MNWIAGITMQVAPYPPVFWILAAVVGLAIIGAIVAVVRFIVNRARRTR